MKQHMNKLWAKIVTFLGMTGTAFLFCLSFLSAWYHIELVAMLINVACVVVFIPCFSFQLRSAGHWEGHEGLYLTWLDRIPLDVYLKNGRMKMNLGLCRGKHLHDKRATMAEKDVKREMERAMRGRAE